MLDDNNSPTVKTDNSCRWIKCRKQPSNYNYSKWNTTKGFENFYRNKKKRKRESYQDGKNLIVKVNDKVYTYPPKAGILIFDRTLSKVLAVKNCYNPKCPKWGLPKGHMESDENLKNCAIREFYEETGLTINVASGDPYIKINNSVYFVYYLINKISYINPVDTNEINESRFVDINELLSYNSNREMYIALTKKIKFAKKICKGIVINPIYNQNHNQ